MANDLVQGGGGARPEVYSDDFETMERYQALQSGQYWKARFAMEDELIREGDVLLVEKIDWVDDKPHTIILRCHPRHARYSAKTHRMRIDTFLAGFDFEPNHQEIRNKEILELQNRVGELNQELIETQTNPALLNAVVAKGMEKLADEAARQGKTLPATLASPSVQLNVGTALESGVSEMTVEALRGAAERQHSIAKITATWMKEKTKEIADTIAAMTPYFEEQAAAALAQTDDVQKRVKKIMNGIESLDIYIGKGVYVDTIHEGEDAPADEPLTMFQRRLYMDEEMAVFADVEESFDYRSVSLFTKALTTYPELLEQIIPAKRGVVLVSATRRRIQYNDNPLVDAMENQKNKHTFLLVRNGENLHMVVSPIESHTDVDLLFPKKTDTDDIFKGVDGRNITFEDLDYTRKLDQHEAMAMHYKRFLILFCGLDHRLNLFGKFYEGPQDFRFLDMEFQQQYIRFAADADASFQLSDGPAKESFWSWINRVNDNVQSGSRVACFWPDMVYEEEVSPGFTRMASKSLKRNFDTCIVRREGEDLVVDVEFTHGWRSTDHSAKVFLKKHRNNSRRIGFLCLDHVRPEELRYYIENRDTRVDQIDYIRLFKRALKHIEHDREKEAGTREAMRAALIEGKICAESEMERVIDGAVAYWRAVNRGEMLPVMNNSGVLGREMTAADWKSLLDQMYNLAGRAENLALQVKAHFEAKGDQVFQINSKNGKMIAYVAPREEEIDNRVIPHAWVKRIPVEIGRRGGVVEKAQSWVLMRNLASESVLLDSAEGKAWQKQHAHVTFEYNEVQKACDLVDKSRGTLEAFGNGDDSYFMRLFVEWEIVRNRLTKKSVAKPYLLIPFAVLSGEKMNELTFVCIDMPAPDVFLHKIKNPGLQEEIIQDAIAIYRNKDWLRVQLREALTSFHHAGHRGYEITLKRASDFRHAYEFLDSGGFKPYQGEQTGSLDQEVARMLSYLQSDRRERPMSLYIPDNLKATGGRTCLDTLLKVDTSGYDNAVQVWTHSFRDASHNQEAILYEILPLGSESKMEHGPELVKQFDYQHGNSRSHSSIGRFPDLEEARRAIEKDMRAGGHFSEYQDKVENGNLVFYRKKTDHHADKDLDSLKKLKPQ